MCFNSRLNNYWFKSLWFQSTKLICSSFKLMINTRQLFEQCLVLGNNIIPVIRFYLDILSLHFHQENLDHQQTHFLNHFVRKSGVNHVATEQHCSESCPVYQRQSIGRTKNIFVTVTLRVPVPVSEAAKVHDFPVPVSAIQILVPEAAQ